MEDVIRSAVTSGMPESSNVDRCDMMRDSVNRDRIFLKNGELNVFFRFLRTTSTSKRARRKKRP